MGKAPPDLDFKVDEEHWGEAFDPTNEEHMTEGIINGYIARMMICYRKSCREGEDLWYTFPEDFEGVTLDILNIAQRPALRELREQLVVQGVWVKPVRGSTSYAKALHDCLSETTPSEWTEERVKEREQIRGRQKIIQSQSQPTSHQPLQQLLPTQSQLLTAQSQHPLGFTITQQPPRQTYQPYTQFQIPERGDGDYDKPQAKLLTDLMKIYSQEEKKYGGEEYDILDVKLQVFYDCCSKIGLLETQYHNAYSVMLKGRASVESRDRGLQSFVCSLLFSAWM
jgi:hypothetical protein